MMHRRARLTLQFVAVASVLFVPLSATADASSERVVHIRDVARAATRDAPVVHTAARRVRGADARVDVARASYWPTLEVEGNTSVVRQRQTGVLPDAPDVKTRSTAARGTASGRIEWLVTNFRGRAASVDGAESDLRRARHAVTQVRFGNLRLACERFIELLTTQRLRDNAALSVARRDAISSAIGRLVDAGLRPRIDLQRADIEAVAARTELSVLRAQAEAQAAQLAASMGLDPAQALRAGELEEGLLESDESEREVTASALNRRPELPLQQARIEVSRSAARVARASLLPSLHMFADVNAQRDAVQRGNGLDQSGYLASGGVALRFRALNLTSAYELRAAKADVEIELALLREQILRARAEAVTGHGQVSRAREALAQAEQILEAARSTREAQYRRYQGGEASLLELLDAEAVEQEARSRRITTLRDLELSRIALLDAMGMLEDRLAS
jgi:outer membrane protein